MRTRLCASTISDEVSANGGNLLRWKSPTIVGDFDSVGRTASKYRIGKRGNYVTMQLSCRIHRSPRGPLGSGAAQPIWGYFWGYMNKEKSSDPRQATDSKDFFIPALTMTFQQSRYAASLPGLFGCVSLVADVVVTNVQIRRGALTLILKRSYQRGNTFYFQRPIPTTSSSITATSS